MTTIADVIGRVNTQLKDTLWARWPLAELCDYFNDAIRAILLVRPDAGAVMTTLRLCRNTAIVAWGCIPAAGYCARSEWAGAVTATT